MTAFPPLKLKVLPTFPADIRGGTGIRTTKQSGHVVVDMDWDEFGLQSSIPTSPTNNVLTFDTATDQYVMIPSSLLGGSVAGISDAPVDGIQYGRQSAGWTPVIGGSFTQAGAGAITRTMQNKVREVFSVRDFGAVGDFTTDDTAAIQAAVTAGRYGVVYFPPGGYKISNAITLETGSATLLCGSGGNSVILQANLTANAFNMDMAGAGGGIRDMAIRGNSAFYNSPGSSGIALNVTRSSENFIVNNVRITNFDIGLKFSNDCSSGNISGLSIAYFRTYGVWFAANGPTSGDNRFAMIKIQNINFVQADGSTPLNAAVLTNPPAANTQIAVFYQESGGDIWQNVDTINTGYGLVAQPVAGKVVFALSFTDCLFDTAYYDALVLDGSVGRITSLHFTDLWAAYSMNGSGIRTTGSNIDEVQFIGGRFRQNGKHGVDHSGGVDIDIVGASIIENSKLTTNTYHGVNVAAGVSRWSITKCRISNPGIPPTSWGQHDNIHIASGASDNYFIEGNDLSLPGSGGSPLSNAATGLNFKVRGNLPVLQGVDIYTMPFIGVSQTVPTNSTGFLGINGFQATEAQSCFVAHKPLQIIRWGVAFSAAPGAQTYTFQLSVGNTPVGTPAVVTGGSFTVGQFENTTAGTFSAFSIKVITSSGAPVVAFRYFIVVGE